MTQQQHESRWSLAHTGNRVLLAVLIGLVVSAIAGAAGITGAARILIFGLVAGLTYLLATVLRR